MRQGGLIGICLLVAMGWMAGCATMGGPEIEVDKNSREPGSWVDFNGKPHDLIGKGIQVGDRLPSVPLTDASRTTPVVLSKEKGMVLFLSIVPSIDTGVCDAQTHYLGEEGDELPVSVKRITISRDTPYAQQRFAREAGLGDIQYLSDYKAGDFGKAMGLLVEDLMLLARAVVIADKEGVVRYIQVVPEMAHLPDMEAAFKMARKLAHR